MDEDIVEELFDAEIIETDLNELCRICGSTSDSPLVPIYEENGLVEELASKIMLYLPIKISEDDELPINVCVNCANGVLTWHLLFECCVDANKRFQAMLNEMEESRQQSPDKNTNITNKTLDQTMKEQEQNTTVRAEEPEMEDVMFLRAEYGPEDEQYLEDETHLADEELELKNGDQLPLKNRIFKSRQQHQCMFCKEVYTAKDSLNEHLRNNHYNQIFHCDVCNEYKDQNDLISHMTQHALNSLQQQQAEPHQPESRPEESTPPNQQAKAIKPKTKTASTTAKLKCKKCDKIFTSISGVQYHMNAVHDKLKTCKCTQCDKMFSCKRILDNHIRSMHVKKKDYQCDLCEKAFKTDAALYSHKKVHDNAFPFECEKCGKTFRFKHHHVSHLEIHNLEKKYSCNICSKQFYSKANLSKHLKTHESALEYTCHICNVKLKQRRYLYEHMKRAHKPILNKPTNN